MKPGAGAATHGVCHLESNDSALQHLATHNARILTALPRTHRMFHVSDTQLKRERLARR